MGQRTTQVGYTNKNGQTVIHERKCPEHQGGALGLPFEGLE